MDLNDNEAMSDACGAGYTVVGWDDARRGISSWVRLSSHQNSLTWDSLHRSTS